jgi:hypothetical protein
VQADKNDQVVDGRKEDGRSNEEERKTSLKVKRSVVLGLHPEEFHTMTVVSATRGSGKPRPNKYKIIKENALTA